MANISVTVDSSNIFTITLDKNDWISMGVGDKDIPPYDGPDSGIGYQYSGPGPIDLRARAQGVTLVNPGELMTLNGSSADQVYTFKTGFGETGEPDTIFMIGHLELNPDAPGGKPGPILFSQDHLTGEFGLKSS